MLSGVVPGTWHRQSLKNNRVREPALRPLSSHPLLLGFYKLPARESNMGQANKRVLSSHRNRIAGAKSTRRSIWRPQPDGQPALKATSKRGCKCRRGADFSWRLSTTTTPHPPLPKKKKKKSLEEGGREGGEEEAKVAGISAQRRAGLESRAALGAGREE